MLKELRQHNIVGQVILWFVVVLLFTLFHSVLNNFGLGIILAIAIIIEGFVYRGHLGYPAAKFIILILFMVLLYLFSK